MFSFFAFNGGSTTSISKPGDGAVGEHRLFYEQNRTGGGLGNVQYDAYGRHRSNDSAHTCQGNSELSKWAHIRCSAGSRLRSLVAAADNQGRPGWGGDQVTQEALRRLSIANGEKTG